MSIALQAKQQTHVINEVDTVAVMEMACNIQQD